MFGWSFEGLGNIFSAVSGSLLWTAIGLLVWWGFFVAPLGRRRFVNRLRIAAAPQRVWDAYLFDQPAGGWTGEVDIDHKEMLKEPRRSLMRFRPVGSRLPFKSYVDLITEFEAPTRFAARSNSVDGATIAEKDVGEIGVCIAPDSKGAAVEVTRTVPLRGVYNYLTRRRVYRRELERLRAACEGLALPRRAVGLGPLYTLALVALALAPALYAYSGLSGVAWFAMMAIAVMLEIVILVHEFGHWIAMRRFGHRDATIALIPFFGGAAVGSKPAESRFESAMIALMGPALTALVLLALIPTFDWASWVLDGFASHYDAHGRSIPFRPREHLTTLALGVFGMGGFAFAAFAVPINLVNLAPIGMMDGAKVIDACAENPLQRRLYRLALAALLCFCFVRISGPANLSGAAVALALIWLVSGRAANAQPLTLAPLSLRQRSIVVATLAGTVAVYGLSLEFGLRRLYDSTTALQARVATPAPPGSVVDDKDDEPISFGALYPTPRMIYAGRSTLR